MTKESRLVGGVPPVLEVVVGTQRFQPRSLLLTPGNHARRKGVRERQRHGAGPEFDLGHAAAPRAVVSEAQPSAVLAVSAAPTIPLHQAAGQ